MGSVAPLSNGKSPKSKISLSPSEKIGELPMHSASKRNVRPNPADRDGFHLRVVVVVIISAPPSRIVLAPRAPLKGMGLTFANG